MALASRPECASDTALVQEPTPDGHCVVVTPDSARAGFYGHCAAADIEDALPRLRPLPVQTVLDPIRLRHAAPPVPLHYIACTQDRAMPIALQRYFINRTPGISVTTLDSDHSPFISHPDELMAALQNQL